MLINIVEFSFIFCSLCDIDMILLRKDYSMFPYFSLLFNINTLKLIFLGEFTKQEFLKEQKRYIFGLFIQISLFSMKDI